MSKREVRAAQKKVAEQIKNQFNTANEKGEEEMVTTEEMAKIKEILTEAIENSEEVSEAARKMIVEEINDGFDAPAEKKDVKGFFKKIFTKKNVVRVVGATAVVAVIGGVIYMVKNGKFEDESVSIDATDDMVTITDI